MRFPSKTRLLLAGGLLAALSRLPGLFARRESSLAGQPYPSDESQSLPSGAAPSVPARESVAQLHADGDEARQRAADDGYGGAVGAASATATAQPAIKPS